jgi:hypothetical protein
MSTTTTPTTSVFESLGYQVMSRERGIYVLRNSKNPAAPAAVALLLAPYPAAVPTLPVKLFLQRVPAGVPAEAIVAHWGELDARRFEETGLDPTLLELGPVADEVLEQLVFERPEGGKRFAVKLPAGDVVCFN